ncbi:MAG: DUF3488 domain-containing protein [Acidobacteria bacterium]|nr:MAG: DUF3488 domain-containing protein [Acidobacteriota bacterium]REK08694.1 MAG: DUF3488 domain-containing protein [Acidobacteriota bacterium]
MRYADDKRLALGVLAALVALPLPLNEPRPEGVVGWGFLLLYELGVAYFLLRVRRAEERWLNNWLLNLLGLVYLPFLVLDLTALSRGQLLRPMMHLALFVVLAKLFSLRRDRDKWQTLVAIFFIFVTAMATSASPGIVAYMVVFGLLGVRVLGDFANYHLLSLDRAESSARPPREPGRTAALLVLAAVLLAVPLFVLLPRFREPFVLGSGSSGQSTSAGFSDEAGLDVIARIRTSREVALRIEPESGSFPAELRLRGATFDRYAFDHWERSGGGRALPRSRSGEYRLEDGDATSIARIWLEPIGTRALIVPQETLWVDFVGSSPSLGMNRGGALGFAFQPRETLSYRVGLSPRPVYLGEPPAAADDLLVERTGVSPRIEAMARQVTAGATGDLERARRLESHLMSEYEYTLDFVGRRGVSPIEEFLFEYGSGHCEYFASSLVLLLRSIGIPARYVTGFLGAERSSMGYAIVRQSNAHAWVEAWIPERGGWVTLDPTPPDGRPGISGRSLGALMRQAYDYLIFRWDRYVITFSQGDQERVFERIWAWIRGLWRGDGASSTPLPPPTDSLGAPPADAEQAQPATRAPGGIVPLTIVLTVLLLLWFLLRPRRLDPVAAFRRLPALGEKVGASWKPAMAPRLWVESFAQRCPAAAEPLHRILRLYLEQSFSGRPLLDGEPNRRRLRELNQALRRDLLEITRAVAARRRELIQQEKLARRHRRRLPEGSGGPRRDGESGDGSGRGSARQSTPEARDRRAS